MLAAQRLAKERLAHPAVLPEVRRQVHQFHHLGLWRAVDPQPAAVDGVILLATLTYFLAPASVTYHHLGRSLYFSIVTFVTLGYGDISQTSSPLQLLSAIEAFCGMFLTGLFLAGFASKTKQY